MIRLYNSFVNFWKAWKVLPKSQNLETIDIENLKFVVELAKI